MIFEGFDLNGFWKKDGISSDSFRGASLTDAQIQHVEAEFGYKLPKSYVELLRSQNGGTTDFVVYPTTVETSWAEDHIAINAVMGLDPKKAYSLLGMYGNNLWVKEFGYPNIGLYVCDCPSAGHDMIALDYTNCGKDGEPEVVHIDQEWDFKKTVLAKDFETFIRRLKMEDY